MSVPLKYLCDHIRLIVTHCRLIRPPLFALSILLICHDLFLPRVRTTMEQTMTVPSIGTSLWNRLHILLLFTPLFLFLHLSLVLNLTFFLELKCTESASVWHMP